MRRGLLAALSACLLVTSSAAADQPDQTDQCIAAYESGQEQRIAGKLLQARDSLRTCAASACPAAIAGQCATWLDEVGTEIPTVVLVVRDSDGKDVVDVTVSIDGKELDGWSGKARPFDPGSHQIEVSREGEVLAKRTFVARVGERKRRVELELKSEEEAADTGATSAVGATTTSETETPVLGYVIGGLGLAALGVATFLWLDTLSEFSRLEDECRPNCAQSDEDSVASRALLGDILGAVGVAGIGFGGYLILNPSDAEPAATGMGFTVSGRF